VHSDVNTGAVDSFAAYLQYTCERKCASVARELHDAVGGALAAAKMQLDLIARLIPEGTGDVHGRLLRLSSALDAGLAVERRLVESLRPSVLDHLGLYVALRWQIAEQCKLAGRECLFDSIGDEPHYVRENAIVVLRMVEDAMVHALARRDTETVAVDVQVVDAALEVSIQRDGAVPAASTVPQGSRLRLWAAGERAHLLGGECRESHRPGGSTILLRVPVANLERTAEWLTGE
jgi:signal transduction histidine kinase